MENDDSEGDKHPNKKPNSNKKQDCVIKLSDQNYSFYLLEVFIKEKNDDIDTQFKLLLYADDANDNNNQFDLYYSL